MGWTRSPFCATVDGLHVMCVGRAGVFIKPSIIESGTFVLTIPQDSFRVLLSESPEFVARVKELISSRRPPPKPSPG